MIIFQINENNSVLLTTNYSIEFEERTMFEGYCTLYYGSYSPWITRFLFSLSNDGTQFSESYSVYVYQSVCQTFQNDSGDIHFTLQVCATLTMFEYLKSVDRNH